MFLNCYFLFSRKIFKKKSKIKEIIRKISHLDVKKTLDVIEAFTYYGVWRKWGAQFYTKVLPFALRGSSREIPTSLRKITPAYLLHRRSLCPPQLMRPPREAQVDQPHFQLIGKEDTQAARISIINRTHSKILENISFWKSNKTLKCPAKQYEMNGHSSPLSGFRILEPLNRIFFSFSEWRIGFTKWRKKTENDKKT